MYLNQGDKRLQYAALDFMLFMYAIYISHIFDPVVNIGGRVKLELSSKKWLQNW